MRGYRQFGGTSEPIGDEAFFQYDLHVDSRLELAYRRFNTMVYFKADPSIPYRRGEENLRMDADKKELEQVAKVLDDAILNRNPNISVENIRVHQVVGARIKGVAQGLVWFIHSLYHPGFHF